MLTLVIQQTSLNIPSNRKTSSSHFRMFIFTLTLLSPIQAKCIKPHTAPLLFSSFSSFSLSFFLPPSLLSFFFPSSISSLPTLAPFLTSHFLASHLPEILLSVLRVLHGPFATDNFPLLSHSLIEINVIGHTLQTS